MNRIVTIFLLVPMLFFAQEETQYHLPAKSPRQIVQQNFSVSSISVSYGRPSAKGRTIFGSLVPFNKIWRLGANEATTITFGQDVRIQNQIIPAGTYAFYAIPTEKSWTLILNKGVKNWGAYGYKEKDDIARFTVPVSKLEFSIESLSFWFEEAADINKKSLNIGWENTSVSLDIEIADDKWVEEKIKELKKKK